MVKAKEVRKLTKRCEENRISLEEIERQIIKASKEGRSSMEISVASFDYGNANVPYIVSYLKENGYRVEVLEGLDFGYNCVGLLSTTDRLKTCRLASSGISREQWVD